MALVPNLNTLKTGLQDIHTRKIDLDRDTVDLNQLEIDARAFIDDPIKGELLDANRNGLGSFQADSFIDGQNFIVRDDLLIRFKYNRKNDQIRDLTIVLLGEGFFVL